jgi:hypothetical protein
MRIELREIYVHLTRQSTYLVLVSGTKSMRFFFKQNWVKTNENFFLSYFIAGLQVIPLLLVQLFIIGHISFEAVYSHHLMDI